MHFVNANSRDQNHAVVFAYGADALAPLLDLGSLFKCGHWALASGVLMNAQMHEIGLTLMYEKT